MALPQRYSILPCSARLLHSLSCVFPKVRIQMGGLLTGKFIFCPQSWFLLISGASCMSNCASFITSNNGVEPCQALAPLSIGFVVFMVHLATIPVTGTGINPARSFGAVVIYGHKKSWDDHWIFWVGPLIGATVAAAFHKYVIRASLKWHSKEPNNV